MKTFIGILNLNFLLEIQCETIILTPASVVYHQMDSAPQKKAFNCLRPKIEQATLYYSFAESETYSNLLLTK